MKKYSNIIISVILSTILTLLLFVIYTYGLVTVIKQIKLSFIYLFYLGLPVGVIYVIWRQYRVNQIRKMQKKELSSFFNMIEQYRYKENNKKHDAMYIIFLIKEFYNCVKIYNKDFPVPTTLALETLTDNNSEHDFGYAFTLDYFRLENIYSIVTNNYTSYNSDDISSTLITILPK